MKINTRTILKEILEWIYCIIIAVILALIVRYYIGTPTVVQMTSMKPTFEEGDRLILNRLPRTFNDEYERGDIITFEAPSSGYNSPDEADQEDPVAKYEYEPATFIDKFKYYVLDIEKKSYIKRVIGLEGERVQILQGNVYINGSILEEEYIKTGMQTVSPVFTDFVVPEGYVFVMGDNRPYSEDSRELGCIPISKIESKVCLRFWPFEQFGNDW